MAIAAGLPAQTQQALSQVAARLEKLGFIERRVNGGRGIGLHLTAAGSRAREKAHEAAEGFEMSLAAALGTSRHLRLVQLLEEAEPIIRELEPRRRGSSRARYSDRQPQPRS